MMPSLIRNFDKRGFTLVEVIVTIVAAAILGVIFINFMGTAMSKSTRAVSNVEAEANAQALMEQIVSDYVVKINEGMPVSPPPNALDFIFNKDYGTSVTKKYITFSPSGDQVESGSATDTMKITVVWDSPDVTQTGGTAITTLLTKSRLSAADPAVAF
jgi:prepilin-type N-terminal cleavage/methylation domain-containing protein